MTAAPDVLWRGSTKHSHGEPHQWGKDNHSLDKRSSVGKVTVSCLRKGEKSDGVIILLLGFVAKLD